MTTSFGTDRKKTRAPCRHKAEPCLSFPSPCDCAPQYSRLLNQNELVLVIVTFLTTEGRPASVDALSEDALNANVKTYSMQPMRVLNEL